MMDIEETKEEIKGSSENLPKVNLSPSNSIYPKLSGNKLRKLGSKKTTIKYFTGLQEKHEKEEEEEFEQDSVDMLELMKMEMKVFNCDKLYEELDEFVFKENTEKKFATNQTEFEKTKYSDKGSFFKFYSKYHKNDEFSRKGNLVNKTPSFNFIDAVKSHKIVPNPVGIVRREGEESRMDLNHHRIGDSYVLSLVQSMKISDHISQINLSENRLTNLSVIPLIKTIKDNPKLCKKVTHLNLSFNKLGQESIYTLCEFIEDKNCELAYINLEANCLGNRLVIKLCEEIVKNLGSKMRYLNFGQNNLNDTCALNIAAAVETCEYLQVLILYQNQFKNFGAAEIVSKIKRHVQLKVFDISWNLIGNNLQDYIPSREELMKSTKDKNKFFFNAELDEIKESMELTDYNPIYKKKLNPLKNTVSLFAKELGEMFKEKDSDLIHLDISHNNIGYTDSAHISEEVKANHIILGIHCDGNDMAIDELGFISPVEKSIYGHDHFANSQIYYRIDQEHPLIKTNVLSMRRIRQKNNCWICEGWKETKFIYKPQHFEGPIEEVDVKLHLHFEHYKPFDTILRQDQFVCHRMCPPGELLFYYTVNGVPVENYGQITHKLKDAITHQETNEDGEVKQYIVTKVARTVVDINPNVIDHNTYKKMIKFCEPRPEKKIHKAYKPRTPWTFPISIWAAYEYQYEGDSEEYIDDVFEFDFNRCQFHKETKSDSQLLELKTLLRGYFRKIIDCYRYYSSLLGSNIWQISKNTLNEFANLCPGLLSDTYNINDVYLQQKGVINALIDKDERTKNKNKNVPDNLIRHQFMGLLVKVAKDKYLRAKAVESLYEAVKISFESHFLPVINEYDVHKWRLDRYYNEFTDNVIKAYLPILDAVYKSWTSMKEPGRRDTWMNLDEFNNVMLQIVDNEFPVREIPIAYNHAIRLQVNEIDNDKHLKMLFPEFIEAFCRVVDKYSPIPPDEKPEDWTLQNKIDQHLSAKIENVMMKMIKLITHPDYKFLKEKFTIPSREEETGLLKYDIFHPHYLPVWPKGRRMTKLPTNLGTLGGGLSSRDVTKQEK